MNGEWSEMQKLVISKMDEHTRKLVQLHTDVTKLDTQVAIMADREDRELLAARSVATKWSVGVSAVISGVLGYLGLHD